MDLKQYFRKSTLKKHWRVELLGILYTRLHLNLPEKRHQNVKNYKFVEVTFEWLQLRQYWQSLAEVEGKSIKWVAIQSHLFHYSKICKALWGRGENFGPHP